MLDGFETRITFTEAMVRAAVREFVSRRLLRRWWIWLTILALFGASLVFGARGGSPFMAGASLAGVVFVICFVGYVWRAHFINSVGRFRAMKPPAADFVFRETEMVTTSSLGSSTLPYARFTELWEMDEFWMLFLAPNNFLTLPIGGLPAEVVTALRAKLPKAAVNARRRRA